MENCEDCHQQVNSTIVALPTTARPSRYDGGKKTCAKKQGSALKMKNDPG